MTTRFLTAETVKCTCSPYARKLRVNYLYFYASLSLTRARERHTLEILSLEILLYFSFHRGRESCGDTRHTRFLRIGKEKGGKRERERKIKYTNDMIRGNSTRNQSVRAYLR